jgi:hypothetical protein
VVVPFVGNAIIKGVYVSPQKMKLKKQKRDDVCVRLLALSPPGGGLEECSSSSSSRDDPFLTAFCRVSPSSSERAKKADSSSSLRESNLTLCVPIPIFSSPQ